MTLLEFADTQIKVDLEDYPPAPVAWILCVIDTFCLPLQCSNWRENLKVPRSSWLSARVPSIITSRPPLLSYSEFMAQNDDLKAWDPLVLYRYLFKTPSTVFGDVGTPHSLLLILILLMFLRYTKSFLNPCFHSFARTHAQRSRGTEWVKTNPQSIQIFAETVHQLLAHSFFTIYGFLVFRDAEWWAREGVSFTGTMSLTRGFPYHPIEPRMAWFYILQAVYNLEALISTIQFHGQIGTSSPRQRKLKGSRGTFSEMIFHDILTNTLVFGSSFCRFSRFGSMVFLMHDISAIPVKVAMLSRFLDWDVINLVSFHLLLLTWIVTRLYILPLVILRAALLYAHHVLEEGLSPMFYICYRHAFQAGVVLLCLMQFYWFKSYCIIYVRMLEGCFEKVKTQNQQAAALQYPHSQ